MLENPHIVSSAVLTSHWLIVICLSARVIARRLPVGVSLAWLAVLFSVPYAGAAAYMVFGGKRLDRRWIARLASVDRAAQPSASILRQDPSASSPAPGTPGHSLCRQALAAMGVPALHGNRMKLLEDCQTVFDALIEDINRATQSCRLAFYIWHEGGEADRVFQALIDASARGERCKVLLDAIGSKPFLDGKSRSSLMAAGIEVAAALSPVLGRRADLRYHRKVVVIDDRIAYVGSQNLVDPRYFKQDAGVGQWVDAVARIEGPSVTQLRHFFELDWCVETGSVFADAGPPTALRTALPGDALVQVVPSGPAPYPETIHRLLLSAIYSAQRSLTLTTPYFVPDESLMNALISAAQSGVAVTLIVPARNDSFLVRHASEANYEELLEAGVHIALFGSGLLHTKSLVVDNCLGVFGSVNFDMRSFWLNFEISLLVYGTAFTRDIGELQNSYRANSTLIDAREWRRRGFGRRTLGNAARLLSPLL